MTRRPTPATPELRELLDSLSMGIIRLDDARVGFVNRAALTLLQLESAEVGSAFRWGGDWRAARESEWQGSIDPAEWLADTWATIEFDLTRADGPERGIHVRVRRQAGGFLLEIGDAPARRAPARSDRSTTSRRPTSPTCSSSASAWRQPSSSMRQSCG